MLNLRAKFGFKFKKVEFLAKFKARLNFAEFLPKFKAKFSLKFKKS